MKVDHFLDTNILVYAFSNVEEESRKQARAKQIVASVDFGISGQVLAELYVSLTRKSHIGLSPEKALAVIQDLKATPCVIVDFQLVEAGIRMSQRYQTSYWDGAILAAAEHLGAKIVYSEDMSHGQRYGSVTVENPFLEL